VGTHRSHRWLCRRPDEPKSDADDAAAQGIDCFDLGYYLGRKQLQAMKDRGIWLCPTIGVSQASVMEFF
jgi:hypothetical protein